MLVRQTDEVPNALAAMMGDLLSVSPARVRNAVVSVRARDLGLSATVDFHGGEALVRNGVDKARTQVHISSDAASLMQLADAPRLLGLPSPFTSAGRASLRKILRREIRIRGGSRHPLALLSFSRALGR